MDEDLHSIADARACVRRARAALDVYRRFDQEAVDRITCAAVEAGHARAEDLGAMAVEETGIGRAVSKADKNRFATRGLWHAIRAQRTCGIVSDDPARGITEVADPFGVVAAIIPTTNPTSTALFKAIICLKSRNAMVASPHPRAVRCVAESVRIVHDAAVAAGAPRDLLACMTQVTLEGTQALMKDDGVDLILATGGSALVRAAYSSGKPAFGVGPGNVPVYVDRSADVAHAARCLVDSQTFDNSTLCTSEQAVVCDRPVADALLDALRARGAHVCSPDEVAKLEALVIRNGVTNTEIVGWDAPRLAAKAGFAVPAGTTVLIGPYEKIGKAHPLSREKLCPILAFYRVDGWEAGCRHCIALLNLGGRGHTLGLHGEDESVIRAFALEKPVNRIVVNSPTAQGGVGFTTALFPSMTLGCGSFGGNITSDNIGPHHLLNIKRVARVLPAYRAGALAADWPPLPPLSAGAASPAGGAGAASPAGGAGAASTTPAPGSAWENRPLGRAPAGRQPQDRNPAALRPAGGTAGLAGHAGNPATRRPGEHFSDADLERLIADGLARRQEAACPFGSGPDCRSS